MGPLPGSQDPDEQWVQNDYAQKSRFYDKIQDARKANRGTLNPSAYCYGTSANYLGLRGPFYTALPYGIDSSNIQAVINMPAYWQRVYYKKDGLKAMGLDKLEDDSASTVSAVAPVAPEKSSRPSSAPHRRSSDKDKGAVERETSPPRSEISSTSVASSILRRALRPSSAPSKRTGDALQASTSVPQLKLSEMKHTSASSDVGSRVGSDVGTCLGGGSRVGSADRCKGAYLSTQATAVDNKKVKRRPSSAPVKRSPCPETGSTVSVNSKASSLESYLKKMKKKRPSSSCSQSSAPALGLDAIRKSMHPIVMTAGKPKLCAKLGYGEKFNFHNTLAGQTYAMKAGAGLKGFDYDKLGHRSSKHEINFMQSLRYRMDLDCVMEPEKVIAQGPLK